MRSAAKSLAVPYPGCPLQVEFNLASLSLDASALQLHGGAAVRGLALRVVQSAELAGEQRAGAAPSRLLQDAPGDLGSPGGPQSPLQQPAAPPLACLTATWQSLELRLGPAEQGPAPPPPAVAFCCQSADVSLELGGRGGALVAAQPLRQQALALCLDTNLNALHTSVGHEAVPGLVAALAALAPARSRAAAEDGTGQAAAVPAEDGTRGRQQKQRAWQLAEWQVRVRLGEGSSLRFVDGGGEERWVSSIEAARLVAAASGAQHAPGDGGGGGSWGPTGQVAVDFEVQQIAMQAVQAGQQQQQAAAALQRVVAARLVRFNLQPQQQQQPQPGLPVAAAQHADNTASLKGGVLLGRAGCHAGAGHGAASAAVQGQFAALRQYWLC